MLSLGNTYSQEDLEEFDGRVAKGLEGEPYEYFCELKFDGVSISLIYENGILTKGVTRGDGVRGDEVTNNIKTIRTVPLKAKGKDIPPRSKYAERCSCPRKFSFSSTRSAKTSVRKGMRMPVTRHRGL